MHTQDMHLAVERIESGAWPLSDGAGNEAVRSDWEPSPYSRQQRMGR